MQAIQRHRLHARLAFFALFVLAPPLDLLRYDLTLKHLIVLGQPWTLGLDPFLAGEVGAGVVAWNLFWRGLLPLVVIGGGLIFVAWRYGRLYCGWLCPHFSVVELINGLMRRAWGRPTLWERAPLPARRPDGREIPAKTWYWLPTALAVGGFAFLWALTLLTYLLPPFEIYDNLLHGGLTRNQTIFLGVATGAFAVEFLLARHLFCRFGCAVGLFQSLAWMANRKAMVVGYDKARAGACADCFAACDHACPMRLKPRSIKRKMFTCTQCTQCISACRDVQADNPQGALLQWVDGADALGVSDAEVPSRRRAWRLQEAPARGE